MSKQSPYLQRRGDTFSFRIAVPSELRLIVGKREVIKSLQITDKRIAIPLALRFAATMKQLFSDLSINMSQRDPEKFVRLLMEAKYKNRLDMQREEHEQELSQLHIDYAVKIKQAKLEAENEAFKRATPSFQSSDSAYPYLNRRKCARSR